MKVTLIRYILCLALFVIGIQQGYSQNLGKNIVTNGDFGKLPDGADINTYRQQYSIQGVANEEESFEGLSYLSSGNFGNNKHQYVFCGKVNAFEGGRWLDCTDDRVSGGLMLVAEAKVVSAVNTQPFYRRKVKALHPEMWYYFSAKALNVFNTDIVWEWIVKTWIYDIEVIVKVNDKEQGRTPRLYYNTRKWETVDFNVQVPAEGQLDILFNIDRVGNGTNESNGFDVALDDIELKPYLLTPSPIVLEGCSALTKGSVNLLAAVSGGPTGNETKYGRWMRRDKGTETWEWIGDIVEGNDYACEQDTATFRQSEYRVLFSFSKSLLASLATPPMENSDYYAFSEIYAGKALPKPALGVPEGQCKIGTALNLGRVAVEIPEGVSEVSWQVDEGEITTVICPAGQNSVEIDFEFKAGNQEFRIVSYKVPDFCTEALLLTGVSCALPAYIPNTVAGDISAEPVVLCNGESGILKAELARKVIQNPVFYWYDQANLAGDAIGTGLSLPLPAGLSEGEHIFYVTIQADNRCPSLAGEAKEVAVRVNSPSVAAEINVTGDFAVCEHVPLALTASADEAAGVINPQFEWYSSPDFAPESLLAVAPVYYGDSLLPGVQYLYVRMWADNRCLNITGAGKEVEVNITPRSKAAHILVEGDNRICREDMLSLNLSVAPGQAVTHPEFRWYADAGLTQPVKDGVSVSGNEFTVQGLLPGQYNWFATLQGDEVCENEPGMALPIPVTVLDSFLLPVIPVDTVRIFKGDEAVLSLEIQPGTELQYEWYALPDLSGDMIGTAKTVVIPDLTEGVHSFFVRMKDMNSCWSRAVEVPVRVYPATNIRVDDISVCQGNVAQLEVRTTLTDLTFTWRGHEDGSPVLGHDRTLVLPDNLTIGEHVYYVEVLDNTNNLTVKVAAKVNVLPRAFIAGSAFDDNNIYCVGYTLKIPFEVLEYAERYRISLKTTSLEQFDFPEYTSEITSEMLASGELPVAAEDYIIPEAMNGADFVLLVELTGKSLNNGGVIENCSSVRDFAFSVKKLPEIVVDEPEIVCSGGSLSLIPAVTLNDNVATGYEWRMETETGEKFLYAGEQLQLTGLTGEDNGRKIWCCVKTECGWQESNRVTFRVYDEAFNTISYEGGEVYSGMMAKISGSEIPVNGLVYSWEYKSFWGDWMPLEERNTASVYTTIDVASSFRRTVKAGKCGSKSNIVEINVAEFTDTTGTDEGLGRYVYQETFGYVSQFEWAKENGDKRDVLTYRKFDHTGGINLSRYSMQDYEMKSTDDWEESVNDVDRLPEKNPLMFYPGDWVFEETATNLLAEPWKTTYKHNTAYVWCKDFGIVYNSRTEYVENGTYCAGSSLYNQPVRWFNINGSWKMGYWYRYYYSWKSPSMGDGKYALTPSPYQMDPGAVFKYSKSLDHTNDPQGETGLMLMVNSADKDVAYSQTFSGLTGGMWYRLEAWVANAETNGINPRPIIKVEVTGNGVRGEDGLPDPSFTTGSLGRNNELNWTRCTVNFFVPEGVTQAKFAVYNTNGGDLGNVFVLDDISVRELLVKSWELAADFCEEPGKLKFTLSNEIVLPDYAMIYSRLMRKEKSGGSWEWAGEVSDSMKVVTAPEQMINYDFRLATAFSSALIDRIDPNDPVAANGLGYYAIIEKYTLPDFCLLLNGYQVDYVSVPDSVEIKPDFSGVPQGADVYSRFLFRPFGSQVWVWHGEAALATGHYMPWTDLLEGDCRVVYAFSDKLLNALAEDAIVERSAYYVTSDVIAGVKPELTIIEKISDGQVVLKPEVEGLPMGASPVGCWMQREKGTEKWSWLPMNKDLTYTTNLFVYSAAEYRFVYTQSQFLIDTLSVDMVGNGGRGYIVSDIFSGKDYKIGQVISDFCKSPGNVVRMLDFSSEYPESVEIHGRWRMKEKNGSEWSWMSNVVYGLPDFNVGMQDYLNHDYQLILSWSRDSLRTWEAGNLSGEGLSYKICIWEKELPVCISVDTIRLVSVDSAKFELQPEVSTGNATATLAGRWMKAPAGTSQWEWCGGAGTGNVNLGVSEEELGTYDYRYIAGWSAEWLTEEVATGKKPYLVEDTLQSITIVRPELLNTKMFCIYGEDANRVELQLNCPEEVTLITYRIGKTEARTLPVENDQTISFTIDADAAFTLLSYVQAGVCDSVIMNHKVDFAYKPRPQISNMADVFTCIGNEVEVAPVIKGNGNLQQEWYRGEEEQPFSVEDTLRMQLTEPDTLQLRLSVRGEEVCPAWDSVFVIAAAYPEILQDEKNVQICVGEPFRINYKSITADQYRVVLKETNMPGFTLYSDLVDVREQNNGMLEIISGQAPLFATEFMAGYRFTFEIRLYRYVEYNGVVYRCAGETSVTFDVRHKPQSRYVGDIYACLQETIELNPEVETSGNEVTGYTWRLWNGDSLKTDKILAQSESAIGLKATVDTMWQGRRLQLMVNSECGEVVVQDILLNILDNRQNLVTAPAEVVFTGENVRITGAEMNISGVDFQWEYKQGEEEWQILTGETLTNLSIRVPEKETAYRRRIISGRYDCEEKLSNVVVLRVYNNELENLIQMEEADTLVNKGKTVRITGKNASPEDVRFIWQKNDTGLWEDVEADQAGYLEFVAVEMTMIRRKAVVREQEMYSNVLLIDVFDKENNKIMTPQSVLLPGEPLQIIGNYFSIAGVEYQWWVSPESTGKWQLLEGITSRNLEAGIEESALYKREVHLPTGEILESNVVRITVFDNERDNVIGCERLNVCKNDEVVVNGKEIGGSETVYRWEKSNDDGLSWEVMDGQNAASLKFIAQQSILLRRFVMVGKVEDNFSNVLVFNVIFGSEDNTIAFTSPVLSGQEATVQGSEVKNARYIWEKSKDGEGNWEVIAGREGASLFLKEEETIRECYFRRRLKFEDGGCEVASNVLKMVIMDQTRNHITGLEKPICQWSEFTLTGEDLADVDASYQWYYQEGEDWKACKYAFQKDLVVYEGVGEDKTYRRDAIVGGRIYESNPVTVTVWKNDGIENIVVQPEPVCAGVEVVLKGSELLTGEWEGYVKGYYWERSATAAGDSWSRADSIGGRDLTLQDVEETEWYSRVVTTYCGNDLRSKPVLLEVKERLPLTLRHNASFGEMKVKEPIRISVDEEYYSSYEFQVNGEIKPAQLNEYLFYGWSPKKNYQIVANVVSKEGCIQTDTIQMRTPDVDLPNVLTPNNDGYNDVLLAGYDLKVYNRWGNLVYNGQDGWDGRYKGSFVAAGTYFYVVKVKHADGEISEYRKSVTLKRD